MAKIGKRQKRTALGRLAGELREYAAREGLSLEQLAERLDVSRATVYSLAGSAKNGSASSSAGLPRGEVLVAIGTVTGVSFDWLLGFDVPRQREAREKVGDFADHMKTLLEDAMAQELPMGQPGYLEWGEDYELPNGGTAYRKRYPQPSSAFVAEIVDAYWLVRRQQSGELRAPGFHALAKMLRSASVSYRKDHLDVNDDDGGHEAYVMAQTMEQAAREASSYAHLLESKTVDWQDILDIGDISPLKFLSVGVEAWASFGGSGGARNIGLATMVDRVPTVWWVDYNTGEARTESGWHLVTDHELPSYTPPAPDSYWATREDISFVPSPDEYQFGVHFLTEQLKARLARHQSGDAQ